MLTGYNTDIDYAGTVYHVQTEDKGRSNPFVESLVYASGEILYSRRTPYHDLVEQGVEPQAVAAIMERQHRSIVDAIGGGRLHQLMSRDEEVSDDDTTIVRPRQAVAPVSEASLDQVIVDYLQAQRGRAHLVLQAVREHDFAYGGAGPDRDRRTRLADQLADAGRRDRGPLQVDRRAPPGAAGPGRHRPGRPVPR